ncbi:MAG: NADH-quinone oxidoreductase subunit E [Gemmobacter sp.]|uniref:NADH-quinone oxidoreductase subunit E n=1 Tax=Gemmobacter sp. TaxID=1898957 RepID=UPI001A4DC219|nr:NADH-quinone oxidoreductase subunit E [Gemmobacter sp.]MBL8562391.1 NADH-quinone oxidoreductase subunit E [Gemmobacter sp.]
MFRNWGFLLGEIWVLIALAALLGLFAGWLIWGRRSVIEAPVNSGEADRLRLQLGECESRARAQAARITTLEREAAAPTLPAATAVPVEVAPLMAAPDMAAPVMVAAAPLAEITADPLPAIPPATDDRPRRPEALSAARDGRPDDLKLIKGVGPKLEALLHSLGFYHFDQLAHWTAAEIAWVDENLEGFKGRVTRDEWVQQARDLAKGLPPRPGGEG